MSLFRKILKWFYGAPSSPSKSETSFPNQTYDGEQHYYEQQYEPGINDAKNWILSKLDSDGKVHFEWESGNDEAFVTFLGDEDPKKNNQWAVESLIVRKLNIASAGEFQMNGRGFIYLENDAFRANYTSTMKSLIDYDDDTEEEIFSEELFDSGDKLLCRL